MYRLTRHAWLDILLGFVGALALTAALAVVFAAWYLGRLGSDAPILWDGYGFWLGAPCLIFALVVRLRDRRPVFAGAMLVGLCSASLLLVLILWLLDNAIGFSG